jgi:hypothetical protein
VPSLSELRLWLGVLHGTDAVLCREDGTQALALEGAEAGGYQFLGWQEAHALQVAQAQLGGGQLQRQGQQQGQQQTCPTGCSFAWL